MRLPITQEQLADAVSLTPVHVNRTLMALEADGLIRRNKRVIHITDWKQMAKSRGLPAALPAPRCASDRTRRVSGVQAGRTIGGRAFRSRAMAKLKVFRTSSGFHDSYVAAPSRAAALRAWGANTDLFAMGAAEQVTDAKLMAEPLAQPGAIVKRSRGTAGEHMSAAASPKTEARKAEAKPPRPRKPNRHRAGRNSMRPTADWPKRKPATSLRARSSTRR